MRMYDLCMCMCLCAHRCTNYRTFQMFRRGDAHIAHVFRIIKCIKRVFILHELLFRFRFSYFRYACAMPNKIQEIVICECEYAEHTSEQTRERYKE